MVCPPLFLLRSFGVILLAWACYIPEVKIDLNTAYVENGILSQPSSGKGGSTTLLNGKAICTGVFMLGCFESGIKHSWEFREMLKNKTPVEVVFARDLGNSIGALFFNRTFAIEIRLNGKPLPNCSKVEMLNNLHNPYWFHYLISVLIFLFVLPLIFNFDFYHNLLKKQK